MMQKLKIPLIALATVLVFLGASMLIVGGDSKVIAVYAADFSPEVRTLKITVIDPIKDRLISTRNVTLQYPLQNVEGLSVVYSPKTNLLYAKTAGTLTATGMDTYGCPASGECFVSIESFSPEGTDSPIIAYKNDFTDQTVPDNFYADQSRIESYKDTPYFRLLDNHTRRYNEVEFLTVEDSSHMKDPMPTDVSVRTNMDKSDGAITLKKGNVSKEISLGNLGGLESVFYFVAPDLKSFYLTTYEYNHMEPVGAPANPYHLGLEKVDVDTMTASEVGKDMAPRTFSPDGKYLLGYWAAPTGTELIRFNTKTGERVELKAFDPAGRPGIPMSPLPLDFQLLTWVK